MQTTKAQISLCCLISAFAVRCLDSIIPLLAIAVKTLAGLFSWEGRFESYRVANPEDRFSPDMAHIMDKDADEACLKRLKLWFECKLFLILTDN